MRSLLIFECSICQSPGRLTGDPEIKIEGGVKLIDLGQTTVCVNCARDYALRALTVQPTAGHYLASIYLESPAGSGLIWEGDSGSRISTEDWKTFFQSVEKMLRNKLDASLKGK
jgi:hypothetical protein